MLIPLILATNVNLILLSVFTLCAFGLRCVHRMAVVELCVLLASDSSRALDSVYLWLK